MKTALFFLIAFVLILLLFISTSLGIGYTINWLIPRIDLGISTLIGMLAIALNFLIFVRLMSSIPVELPEEVEEEEKENKRSKDIVYLVEGGMGVKKRRKPKTIR
jgi:hypothetical protein